MTDTLDEIWDSLFGGGGGPAEPSSSSAPPQPSNPVVVVAPRPAPAPPVPPPSVVVVPTRPPTIASPSIVVVPTRPPAAAPVPVVVPTKETEADDDGESFFADCCSRTCIIALLLLVASGASIGVIYVVVSLFNADVRDAYTDRINIAKNSFTDDVTRVRAIPSLYNSSDLAPVGTKGPPGGRGVIGPQGFSAPGATGLPGPYGPSAIGITGPTVLFLFLALLACFFLHAWSKNRVPRVHEVHRARLGSAGHRGRRARMGHRGLQASRDHAGFQAHAVEHASRTSPPSMAPRRRFGTRDSPRTRRRWITRSGTMPRARQNTDWWSITRQGTLVWHTNTHSCRSIWFGRMSP